MSAVRNACIAFGFVSDRTSTGYKAQLRTPLILVIFLLDSPGILLSLFVCLAHFNVQMVEAGTLVQIYLIDGALGHPLFYPVQVLANDVPPLFFGLSRAAVDFLELVRIVPMCNRHQFSFQEK